MRRWFALGSIKASGGCKSPERALALSAARRSEIPSGDSRPPLAGFAIVCLVAFASPALAQRNLKDIPDPDPEIERKSFIVADGFEVNLYAADPLLAKPIQMNFDPQGRLWIASSEVYPQIKPGQPATDKILVLEDADRDGQAEKTTVFADGLLIPTGIVPGDGGAYVANSTELIHLADTNGDGKSDRRKVVLSGFGTEDTHHLLHTLRWGPDGCLYMNQSIYIHSHIETPYGVKRLNGGGIWRFRPETLELEVLAYGLVNSWGHHFDAYGQSFATDGAGGEGINYVFPGAAFVTAVGYSRRVEGLNPGSPKHCGLEIVGGRHLPDDWAGSFITNDFRAHRVCRFTVKDDGSGFASRQETEVIKTTHPAFRPIDVKMGPDGAIYIADWYNPIIQHGEVDFRDERRDHTHGRIWRVTAKGRAPLQTRLAAETSTLDLLEKLKEPEEWTRQNAKLMLKNRGAAEVATPLAAWMAKQTDEHAKLEGVWLCESLRLVQPQWLEPLLASNDHRVRAAAVRIASHWQDKLPNAPQIFRAAAVDDHPRVRLEGVRALSQLKTPEAAVWAAAALEKPLDKFLDFALWQTFRDLAPYWLPAVQAGKLDFGGRVDQLTFALKAADAPGVVGPLLNLVKQGKVAPERLEGVLALAASLGGEKELGAVLDLVFDPQAKLGPNAQAAILNALVDAARQRKVKPAGDLNRIRDLLAADDDRLWIAAAKAGAVWKVVYVRGLIEQTLKAHGTSEAKVRGGLEAAALFGEAPDKDLLAELGCIYAKTEYRIAALEALATLDIARASQLTADWLKTQPTGVDPTAVVHAIVSQKGGPAAFAAVLGEVKLPPDIAKLIIRGIRASSQPSEDLIAAVQRSGGLENAGWKLSPALQSSLLQDVQQHGDPARGEAIFRRKDAQCLKCHAIGGAGGLVGPDLVSIGATAQVDYLVESLLAPAVKVKENYHSQLVLMDDGRVVTGIPVRETKTELVLRDADDKLLTLAKDAIEERKDGRSLMPDGLADPLTREEIVDLTRFLSELGKVNGQYAIGQGRVARRWQLLTFTPEARTRLNRSSFDTAATDDPALTWEPAYSLVSGNLPLANLPQFVVHEGNAPATFLRTEIEVTTPGKVKLAVNNATGVAFWLDGKSLPLAAATELDLPTGKHRLTFAVDRKQRSDALRVELHDVAGSECQVQFVTGK